MKYLLNAKGNKVVYIEGSQIPEGMTLVDTNQPVKKKARRKRVAKK